MLHWFKCVKASSNIKTGPMPTTYTDSSSCPTTCPFKKNGCYAALGPINWIWRKVDKGINAVRFPHLVKFIKDIPMTRVWRHNVAGDLPGKGNVIDGGRVKDIVAANKGRHGFTYTHKPILDTRKVDRKVILANRRIIKHANKHGFTINGSANNLIEADAMVKLEIGPVVAVLPSDTKVKTMTTPGGNKVKVCPHYYKNIQCCDCKMCFKADRNYIVGFPAHGTMKKTVDKIAGRGVPERALEKV